MSDNYQAIKTLANDFVEFFDKKISIDEMAIRIRDAYAMPWLDLIKPDRCGLKWAIAKAGYILANRYDSDEDFHKEVYRYGVLIENMLKDVI